MPLTCNDKNDTCCHEFLNRSASTNQLGERVALAHGPYGHIIKATDTFDAGEIIFQLTGDIISYPNKYTIQLDEQVHVLTSDSLWQNVNHSCDANVRVDAPQRTMVAARQIQVGEELNFNYNSTEWSMTSPFPCGCGAASCVGEIRGFRYLSDGQRDAIQPLLSPHIERRWEDLKEKTNQQEISLHGLNPEVHILLPYKTDGAAGVSSNNELEVSQVEFDAWFAPLGLKHVVYAIATATIHNAIAHIIDCSRKKSIVVLNLCGGCERDGALGTDVIKALEASGLPFSGAGMQFDSVTRSVSATKRLLRSSGVLTAESVVITDLEQDLQLAVDKIQFPLLIRADAKFDGCGVGPDSVCFDLESVRSKFKHLRSARENTSGDFLAESLIEGREFAVLVVEDASQPLGLYVLPAAERVFNPSLAAHERVYSLGRDFTLSEEIRDLFEGEQYYWFESVEDNMRAEIELLARRAVRAVDGNGYALVNLRYSEEQKKFYVQEVNAHCALTDSNSSTVGSLLNLSGVAISEVMKRILNHALNREHHGIQNFAEKDKLASDMLQSC